MLISLAVLFTTSAPALAPDSRALARAAVTIRRGEAINEMRWRPAENPSQRQVSYVEAGGRTIVLRLTEFE